MERKTELTNDPNARPHREIDPRNGQQRAYVVLSEDERKKGFVEPLRMSYVHIGQPKPKNLRDLTEEEKERYSKYGYVKFEHYNKPGVTGKYWTQSDLDRLGGCGTVTTMNRSIAETYATDPLFYGATFCCHCKQHYPVGKHGEFVWEGTTQRVGTFSNEKVEQNEEETD